MGVGEPMYTHGTVKAVRFSNNNNVDCKSTRTMIQVILKSELTLISSLHLKS